MQRFDNHVAGQNLRVLQHFGNAEHRARGNAGRCKRREPLRRRLALESQRDQLDQRWKVGHTRRVVAESFVGKKLPCIEHLCQALVIGLVGRAYRDPAVPCCKRLVRRSEWMGRAKRADFLAAAQENGALPERLHDARFEERRVDQLSVTGAQPVNIGHDDA